MLLVLREKKKLRERGGGKPYHELCVGRPPLLMTWIDPIWCCLYMTSPPADGLMCFARLVLDGFESGSDDVGGSWLSRVLLFGLDICSDYRLDLVSVA